jgi:hypothetical protein
LKGFHTRTIGRLRTLLALIALGLALAVAGCGGRSNSPAQTGLSHAIAAELADRADAIADALDAGDECTAAQLADQLKHAVESALAGGQVPSAFRAELERNAAELQNEVNCTEKHDNGKGKKKGKKDESTTTLGTTSISTTTGENN